MGNIAIDGPAGAGKSTIAKMVAKELEFIYVDTGAMYRAIALSCIRHGIDVKDEENVVKACEKAKVTIKYIDGSQKIFLDDEDVTSTIRTEEVGNGASAVSVFGGVRRRLVKMQQELAKNANVVMDGRDIGTVVLPDAELKVFLTASVEERAKRRVNEMAEKGVTVDFEKTKAEIAERDERDTTRKESPLKQAEDAIFLDTTSMSIDEVKNKIIELYNKAVK